jgi:HAD superfamily hydrolase (TIGR01509 family)
VAQVGTVGDEGETLLRAAFGADLDIVALEAAWRDEVAGRYDIGIPLRPGAEALLVHLEQVGVPFALATNARRESAIADIGRAGLARFLGPELIHGRDMVARPKPAPDVFLLAAATLGVDPAACVVFEDSDPGVIGAVAAGMRVVHVPDQRPPGTDAAHHLAETLWDGAIAVGLVI